MFNSKILNNIAELILTSPLTWSKISTYVCKLPPLSSQSTELTSVFTKLYLCSTTLATPTAILSVLEVLWQFFVFKMYILEMNLQSAITFKQAFTAFRVGDKFCRKVGILIAIAGCVGSNISNCKLVNCFQIRKPMWWNLSICRSKRTSCRNNENIKIFSLSIRMN